MPRRLPTKRGTVRSKKGLEIVTSHRSGNVRGLRGDEEGVVGGAEAVSAVIISTAVEEIRGPLHQDVDAHLIDLIGVVPRQDAILTPTCLRQVVVTIGLSNVDLPLLLPDRFQGLPPYLAHRQGDWAEDGETIPLQEPEDEVRHDRKRPS